MPGEERRLGEVQLACALLVVGARRLLDAVGAVPEVDRVQVGRQDPVLLPDLLELPRERRLAHLACERPLVADVRVLDELLGDRRPALDDALLLDVLPERARDTAHVDPVVLVEALILDRDDRLPHDRRDVLGADEDATLVAPEHRKDAAPVRRVDHRVDVGALRRGVERGNLAGHRPDEAEREGQPGGHEQDGHQRRKTTLANPAPRTRRPLLSPNSQEA